MDILQVDILQVDMFQVDMLQVDMALPSPVCLTLLKLEKSILKCLVDR